MSAGSKEGKSGGTEKLFEKNHRRKVPMFDDDYKILIQEFSGGSAGYGSRVVTTVPLVTAVLWVQSLARELPHAMEVKKKSRIQTAQASQPEESMKKTTSEHMVPNDGPLEMVLFSPGIQEIFTWKPSAQHLKGP